MKHRLYHPPPIASGANLELGREQAHYLTRVLRLRLGERVECFDGAGNAWEATLSAASNRSATLQVGAPLAAEPLPDVRLHLVMGLLKGNAMDVAVQKATELGASDLWPIDADRSNVPRDHVRLARKHTHWQRILESAAEQCGALHLPQLHPVQTLADFLATVNGAMLTILDPGGETLPLSLPRKSLAVLVGPEGGWSDTEREAALARGAIRYSLGRRILRGETAPLAVLAAIRHGWAWQ